MEDIEHEKESWSTARAFPYAGGDRRGIWRRRKYMRNERGMGTDMQF